MARITLENLEEIFTYHGPNSDQVIRYNAINKAAKALARVVLENCPDSRERSLALTDIQAGRMWANASIALEAVS